MRFLADMGVDQRVVDGLREQGHEVAHLRDEGLHRMADATVAQAKELLRRLKRQPRVRVRMLADAVGAEDLPGWVKTVRQMTDGHLLVLAKRHSTTLATLDDKIPGAFLVPE